MNEEPYKLWTPIELAKRWGCGKKKVLDLYHTGAITAEIAEGKVYRFDLEKVEKQLRTRAPKAAKKAAKAR